MADGYLAAQPYGGIARASMGQGRFGLPQNFGFNDLAEYEEYIRRLNSSETKKKLADRRAQLSSALTKQGQDLFALQNPKILEDLNSRGLFTSGSAVNQAQADALKEIALSNDKYLNEYDTAATGLEVASDQDITNSVLDLRRSELENKLAQDQANQEQSFAESLARQQRKQGITESLIGLGGQLGGAYLGAKMLGGGGAGGGLSSILGGGGGTASSSLVGGGSPFAVKGAGMFGSGGSLLNTAGTSGFGAGSIAGGLAGYGLGRAAFRPTQEGDRGAQNVGAAIGGVGGSLFGPAGSAVGSFLGAGIGKLQNRLQKGAEKKLGGTAGSIVKYAQPTTAIASVSKKIKKAFCFDGLTPVEMKDGSYKPICELDLDEETKGGTVESIRIAKTSDGTMFKYKDVITTGYHAVKEGNQWVRVKDSLFGEAIPGDDTVYSIVTSGHRVYSNGIEFADEHETDDYENLTIDQSLEQLNRQELVGVN